MSNDEGPSQIPPHCGQTFPDILAPFVPTPLDVVARMLKLAELSKTDIVYDLGCGDGRVLIEAAKWYGASGVGVDVEPYRVAQSQANAKIAGVDHLITFRLQDAQTVDLSPATVIMLYLVHWSTQRLQHHIIRHAKAGTRVVSHNFCMDNWVPKQLEEFVDNAGDKRKLYLWIVKSSVTD
jgi:SAM-dependent methyltransferase